MIHKQFNNAHVLYQQTTDSENNFDLPEPAIALCNDSSGLIVMNQEGRDIVINKESVKELIVLLKLLSK